MNRVLVFLLVVASASSALAQIAQVGWTGVFKVVEINSFLETVEIETTGIDLSYSVAEIEAKAGEKLTIRYVNASETMSHNIVLVKGDEDIRPVGIAALKAHRNDYIPEDEMDRIFAYSELAHPGDTVEFTFTVPPPGVYPYICTYSGHFTMMQGRLIATE